jgi:hypothetical protein
MSLEKRKALVDGLEACVQERANRPEWHTYFESVKTHTWFLNYMYPCHVLQSESVRTDLNASHCFRVIKINTRFAHKSNRKSIHAVDFVAPKAIYQ